MSPAKPCHGCGKPTAIIYRGRSLCVPCSLRRVRTVEVPLAPEDDGETVIGALVAVPGIMDARWSAKTPDALAVETLLDDDQFARALEERGLP